MTSNMTAAKLRQQVTDILTNDTSITDLIAKAVSTLMIEKLSKEETVGKMAESIISKPEFTLKLNDKLMAQVEPIKQEIYTSLPRNNKNLVKKVRVGKTLQGSRMGSRYPRAVRKAELFALPRNC